jgi:hypothetical protein
MREPGKCRHSSPYNQRAILPADAQWHIQTLGRRKSAGFNARFQHRPSNKETFSGLVGCNITPSLVKMPTQSVTHNASCGFSVPSHQKLKAFICACFYLRIPNYSEM